MKLTCKKLTGWAHQAQVGVRIHSLQLSLETQGFGSALIPRNCCAAA